MTEHNHLPSLRDLPLEVRLSAWLDGQTNDEESQELEALVQSDAEAQAILDQLVAGSDAGRTAFDTLLHDPVPLDLVRSIKEAGQKAASHPAVKARPVAANSNIFAFVPRALAASLVLVIAGGYTGFYIGKQSRPGHPVMISESGIVEEQLPEVPVVAGTESEAEADKTRAFTMPTPSVSSDAEALDKVVAGFHKVYAQQGAHLSEIPVGDREGIVRYLSDATDIDVTIPDLSAKGFDFAGARLLAANDRPMATLFYRNGDGEMMMVGIYRPQSAGNEPAKLTAVSFGEKPSGHFETNVIYGKGGNAAVYVALPDTIANPVDVARSVIAAF